eukprot:2830556-Pyramimonas_sp.AAC.1
MSRGITASHLILPYNQARRASRRQAGHRSKQAQQRTIGRRIYRDRRHGVTPARREHSSA